MNLGTSLTINANRHPEKTAIICQNRSYSFRKLNEEVNRIANGLHQLGLQKGDHVALFMKNSDYYAIAFYAIMKAGCVAVPVNFRLTASETNYILDQSQSAAVICDAEFEEIIQKATENVTLLKHVIVEPKAQMQGHISWNEILSDNIAEPEVEILPTDNAEILYTSGTTGKPKGALFDHQRILTVNMAVIMTIKLNYEDRLVHLAPLFHSAQLNLFLTSGIMLGIPSVIMRDFHPTETLEILEEHKITVFFGVPAMYGALLQVPNVDNYDLSSIRACMYGAAPMAPAMVERSMKLFKTDQFYNLCGLTEGGPSGVCLTPEFHKEKLGAGGKAIYFTNVRVVNDQMEDVAPGEIGEFIIKGETLMKEYFGKPEETKKTFSDGWLLTGDLAIVDEDGFVTIVDRKKDMIISGGENVYSVEVEQVLNGYPGVLEAAVISMPDEKWGEIVTAVIVASPETEIKEEELQAFCREKLAGYKIPRAFLYRDALPRNASGKILKYQLRQAYEKEPLV